MTKLYQYDARIVRVIDADSIVVDLDQGFDIWQHDLHVRLAGIDAPERWTLPGKAARDFVEALLPPGTPVVISSEVYDPTDKYGRCLGNVILGDERVLNDLLIVEGLAVAYDGGPRG